MAIIYTYGETKLEESYAKWAAEILAVAYPNHAWRVECRGGALIVKHFDISGAQGSVGMVRHLRFLDHDARVAKEDIKRAAGELLERAGLPRGANDGAPVTNIELPSEAAKHWHPVLAQSKIIT